ncbi:MAG: hypothetical protein OEM60_00500 [Gammaproteobacteria bacterium]|nr:hypothetical protein [Gammaproteobacteria bacterium]MDH3428548.1 hypothetical protein [Gammaproteobacteria bacterium]MDH3432310.1 hypothetical protein [Gammaproteobacteria bacterium]
MYERLPHFLLLVGLIFMSTVMYLGLEHPQAPMYFGSGFFCCLWSMVVFSLRLRHRRPVKQPGAQRESVDQSSKDSEPAA